MIWFNFFLKGGIIKLIMSQENSEETASKEKEKNKNQEGNLLFFRDVASYFMDFLETDFHKRRNPKRSIRLRNADNLLVSMKTEKYPRFDNLLFNGRKDAFPKNKIISFQKGVYKSDIPIKILELIELQVSKIKKNQIILLVEKISSEIEKSSVLFKDDREQAQNHSIEKISELCKTRLVNPFIQHIEKPIQKSDLGDENTIFLAEEELIDVLVNGIESRVSELINLLIVGEKVNVIKSLKEVLTHEFVTESILSFFAQYQVGDLYAEIFELDRNKGILDKQEFYYYFYDISFRKIKYPIFYIPMYISKDKNSFKIEFDSQVYINKKALEFIVQEHNIEQGLKGSLQSIKERIIYLSEGENKVKGYIEDILSELEGFFDLTSIAGLDVTSKVISKSKVVRISNSGYVALFDKSDEALVNDYEDILQKLNEDNSELGLAFSNLIDDFINKDPEPVIEEVENEWRDSDTTDKLVFKSPIPLNSEQRQIVSALKKDKCKYVTVEGPPGTGKSHTITSILFDYVLANQSVLVLSDKKEALDVVEDKIVNTLKSVRNSDNFQNPILRLGKAGSNYGKILSSQSIQSIKNYHNALRNNINDIEETLDTSTQSLKNDLDLEIFSYNNVDINEIMETEALYSELKKEAPYLILDELVEVDDSQYDLENLYDSVRLLKWFVESTELDDIKNILNIEKDENDLIIIKDKLKVIGNSLDIIVELSETNNNIKEVVSLATRINKHDLFYLNKYLNKVEDLRSPVVGLLFKGSKIKNLDKELLKQIPALEIVSPYEEIKNIKLFVEIFNAIEREIHSSLNKDALDADYIEIIHFFLKIKKDDEIQALMLLIGKIGNMLQFSEFPNLSKELSITNNVKDILSSKLFVLNETTLKKALSYIELSQSLRNQFGNIKSAEYFERKKEIEKNTALQMTNVLDNRLIKFIENNRATATAIREVITKKGRFDRNDFDKLKSAFPCILAGIRDYAEYVPLDGELFDLVIIDEASQVSIAQAFPALLRAKKVLIFGDRKQFSNIKASHARSDTNREHLNKLEVSFRENVSSEGNRLIRLSKFNIKTSILEFFEYISNYNMQLAKHFRGYKETISYSNKFFYNDSLQVMKIRSKPISDVLEFTYMDYGLDLIEPIHNSNNSEVDFVIEKLLEMKNSDIASSVGIITPHTNQQRLFAERIGALPESDYFYNKLKLKIMTFDTCQGEERDIIFYSMVANPVDDKLWGIFIKNLSEANLEEDNKIKAQRLNVGFSRAKEKMHFVLSKPIDDFKGSIRDALMHYQNQIKESNQEFTSNDTDSRSAMEPQILNWFYQTEFWKKANKKNTQFIPQFKLGDYLKQLDFRYSHPAYVVDFLLVYKDEKFIEHKIIIEYDGFHEHFQDLDEVNELNFEHYYNEDDVYRQKVLEGYGYQFLRVNKFNIGSNPIEELNNRLKLIINGVTERNTLVSKIQKAANGLDNGDMKKCSKCDQVKELKDFRDLSLVSGVGRICIDCKNLRCKTEVNFDNSDETDKDTKCPTCGSSMALRSGKYGRFYGCSNYPRCRGTRRV